MSVSGNVLKKIRVGRSEKYFIFSFFHFILKWCKMQQEQCQRCKIRPTAEFKRIGNIKGFYLVYKA